MSDWRELMQAAVQRSGGRGQMLHVNSIVGRDGYGARAVHLPASGSSGAGAWGLGARPDVEAQSTQGGDVQFGRLQTV